MHAPRSAIDHPATYATAPSNRRSQPRLAPALAAAVTAAALAGLIAAALHLDQPVAAALRTKPDKTLLRIGGAISHFGDWGGQMALAGCLLGAAAALRRPDLQRAVVAMIVASSVAGLASNAIRGTTGRTRPGAKNVEQGWYGPFHNGKLIVGKRSMNSFPSSHTATAAGFFLLPAMLRRRFIPLAAFAAAVGWARVAIGAHHFSDAVAGFLLGALAAALCARWLRGYLAGRDPFPLLPKRKTEAGRRPPLRSPDDDLRGSHGDGIPAAA